MVLNIKLSHKYNMKKLVSILTFFIVFFSFENQVFSQQDAQLSHYMFNSMYYNPGYAGLEGVTRFTGTFRKQWLGYQASSGAQGGTSPSTAVITGNTLLPFFKQCTGAGFNFVYDVNGPITTTELQVSLAYHLKIKTGKLGIGLRSGIYNQSLNTSDYNVITKEDPVYQSLQSSSNAHQMKADLTGGLYWQTPKYYIGVSVAHLTSSQFTYGIDSVKSKLANHVYVTGGYTFKVGTLLKVTPNAFLQTDTKTYTYLFGGLVTYNDKLFGGISARQSIAARDVSVGGNTISNDDIIFIIGMNMMKDNAMRMSYAFDYVTSGVQAKTRTSHEIMLSYVIPSVWNQPKPIVRTPRYRHEEY